MLVGVAVGDALPEGDALADAEGDGLKLGEADGEAVSTAARSKLTRQASPTLQTPLGAQLHSASLHSSWVVNFVQSTPNSNAAGWLVGAFGATEVCLS